MNQSVLKYVIDRFNENTGRPVDDSEIDFRICYQMVANLGGLQTGKGHDGDYLYRPEDLEHAYEGVTQRCKD